MRRIRKYLNLSMLAVVLVSVSNAALTNCTVWIFHEPEMPKSRI